MDFVEQLKASVDIVKVVGEYVRLRKAGSRWVGLCPFHNEKTPSFGVNSTHQYYKCFGCGAGGDVLKFVMEIEGVTFFEALKILAERNGIPMPKRQEYTDPNTRLRASLFEIHKIAAEAFRSNLFGPNGSAARAYLERRGLSRHLAEEFGLGLSDRSGTALLRLLQQKGVSAEMAEEAGLVSRRQDGSFFDRFRGRLMFPIHNESGSIIGFGGRALSDEDEPKYLNSPKTALYDKSNVLYNLHRAKTAARKHDRIILVEGYMDAIGVYSAGIHEVVASCGTALTSNQVRAIKRHSDKIIVNFDPDAAGANATERSIQMLLDEGMHVRVLHLPGGLDPDEYVKQHGAEAYSRRLERASPYFYWLADQVRAKYPPTAEGRFEGFEKVLLPAIHRLSSELERATLANDVASYLGVDPSLVRNHLRRASGVKNQREQKSATAKPSLSGAETLLIKALVADPQIRELTLPRLRGLKVLETLATRRIFETLLGMWESGSPISFGELESRLEDADKTLLASIVLDDSIGEEVITPEQADACVARLMESELESMRAALRAQIRAAERAGNVADAIRLMTELSELDRWKKARSAS